MDLQYSSSVRKTDISSLDFLWYEPLNDWLDGSVTLGIFDLTQSSNPIPAGQSVSGNSLGLAFRIHLYRAHYLKLHADLAYKYADARADLSGQSVDMHWHQISGQLEADIRIFQYSYLTLAAGTLAIDGNERATGAITSVQSFEASQREYGRLGILIGVDQASHIGIEVSSGAITGGRIYFQRWF